MSGFGRDPRTPEPGARAAQQAVATGPTPWDTMERQLQRDETLIWADRPVDLVAHAKTKIVQSVFGIPFLAFAIFWTTTATNMTAGISSDGIGDAIGTVFPLFGWVFIIVGAGLVLSPVWAALRARKMIYGLTDKRLMIRQELPTTSLRSWPIRDLGPLEREGADTDSGTGSVFFAKDVKSNNNSRGVTVTRVGFVGVRDPKRLEEEIETLRQAHRKG
ncbi:MAG: hypothetical protein AAGI12_07105 [Pseudomonadota bacterium]